MLIKFEGQTLRVKCRFGVHQNLWLVDTRLDGWYKTLRQQFAESVDEGTLDWHLTAKLCNGVFVAKQVMEGRHAIAL